MPSGVCSGNPGRGELGSPRPLVTGEAIVVVVITSIGCICRQSGTATGPAKFLGGFWEAVGFASGRLARAPWREDHGPGVT